jgi:hypothetical protein
MDYRPLEDGTGNDIETQNVFHFDFDESCISDCRAFRVVIMLRYYCNTM